jgi:hypothetical protein
VPEFIGHYIVKKEVRVFADNAKEAAAHTRDMAWAIDGEKTQVIGVAPPGEDIGLRIDQFDYRDPSR